MQIMQFIQQKSVCCRRQKNNIIQFQLDFKFQKSDMYLDTYTVTHVHTVMQTLTHLVPSLWPINISSVCRETKSASSNIYSPMAGKPLYSCLHSRNYTSASSCSPREIKGITFYPTLNCLCVKGRGGEYSDNALVS